MFFGKTGLQYASSFDTVLKINLHDDTFPTGYHPPTTEIV
jgi:hypothetical protein